jgi:hypothetical protein
VDPANPRYSARNGMLLDKAGTTLITYPGAKGNVTDASITVVGSDAFGYCAALEAVSLPAVTSIGYFAFVGCTALTTVSLPAAQTIGEWAFAYTGDPDLEITLGSAAPTLGTGIFRDVDTSKTVTVKVPSGATGYGSSPTDITTQNWGNGFRGKGWTGTAFSTGTLNDKITLTIEEM